MHRWYESAREIYVHLLHSGISLCVYVYHPRCLSQYVSLSKQCYCINSTPDISFSVMEYLLDKGKWYCCRLMHLGDWNTYTVQTKEVFLTIICEKNVLLTLKGLMSSLQVWLLVNLYHNYRKVNIVGITIWLFHNVISVYEKMWSYMGSNPYVRLKLNICKMNILIRNP